MAERKKKTDMPDDLKEIRRRRQAERNRDRVRKVRRMITVLAVLAVVLVVVLITAVVRRHKAGDKKRADLTASSAAGAVTDHTGSEVLHLSFPRLVMTGTSGSRETAGGVREPVMTVEEFNRILDDLNRKGYVLVDLTTLTEKDEDGVYHTKDIQLPGGKKPLVLSQRNVCYSEEDAGAGFATGISLTEEGTLAARYTGTNGASRMAPCDLITCVEAFVDKNPDFSYDNARGILALTGNKGVLGYEDPSSDDCQNVINKLYEIGWKFASYSYSGVSCGVAQDLFEEDARQWQDTAAEGVGRTEIMILPGRADIGSRAPYTEDNAKFRMLSDQGFIYFCIDDTSNLTWMQTGDGFVRQAMHEINSYEQYNALLENGMDSFVNTRAAEEKRAALAASSEEDEGQSGETGTEGKESTDQSEQYNQSDQNDEDDSVDIIEETPI